MTSKTLIQRIAQVDWNNLYWDSYKLSNNLGQYLWRTKLWWITGITALLAVTHFYGIGVNVTNSLPQYVFILHKQVKPEQMKRNDYVTYRWHGAGPYPAGVQFTKIIKGMPGDRVEVRDRDFYVNGEFVGKAKPRALTGQPLEIGATGVIPPGHFYVYAPHPDSLDSRYALTGWIRFEAVVGESKPLF